MTQAEPTIHYAPDTSGHLVGDMRIACKALHWGVVSDDPAQVTCGPCLDTVGSGMPQVIRDAAQALRDAADAVAADYPPPWTLTVRGGAPPIRVVEDSAGQLVVNRYGTVTDYVALMGPLVAVAVAEWLETEAHMQLMRGNSVEGQTFHALKVACAILGGEAPATRDRATAR